MRAPWDQEDLITKEIIGKAIAVHRALGPGLVESVYEYFLAHELRKSDLYVERQKPIPVEYDSEKVDLGFRPDLIVNGEVIVEIKTVQKLAPIHEAQLLSYETRQHRAWPVDQLPRISASRRDTASFTPKKWVAPRSSRWPRRLSEKTRPRRDTTHSRVKELLLNTKSIPR